MSRKIKICIGCQRVFEARADAKTCSDRCRKRFQRARQAYMHERELVLTNSK